MLPFCEFFSVVGVDCFRDRTACLHIFPHEHRLLTLLLLKCWQNLTVLLNSSFLFYSEVSGGDGDSTPPLLYAEPNE